MKTILVVSMMLGVAVAQQTAPVVSLPGSSERIHTTDPDTGVYHRLDCAAMSGRKLVETNREALPKSARACADCFPDGPRCRGIVKDNRQCAKAIVTNAMFNSFCEEHGGGGATAGAQPLPMPRLVKTSVSADGPMPPSSAMPTQLNGMTLASYGRLAEGMTLTSVNSILGREGVEKSRSDFGATSTALYEWKTDDATVIGIFQNGRLVSKSHYGLK